MKFIVKDGIARVGSLWQVRRSSRMLEFDTPDLGTIFITIYPILVTQTHCGWRQDTRRHRDIARQIGSAWKRCESFYGPIPLRYQAGERYPYIVVNSDLTIKAVVLNDKCDEYKKRISPDVPRWPQCVSSTTEVIYNDIIKDTARLAIRKDLAED